jgi:hypothetical protein
MKTVRSLAFATIALLPAAAIAAPPAQAPAQAPSKAVQAPVQAPSKVQAPAQVPAKTAMAPDNSGYRTYSYQPTMAPANYGYGYRSNGPAYRTGPAAQGFYRADHKIVGPY